MKRNPSDILGAVQGFTLLELLLVLVIFSLTAALVTPVIVGGIDTTETKITAKRLGAALNHARSLAVRERINYFVEVRNGNITVASSSGLIKKKISFPKAINISTPSSRMVFFPRGASNGGEFEVRSKGERVFSVKVLSSGRVRMESNMPVMN
ncbi:MAG: GspH/FimT family pseudopilin [Deltaproteobacteria bacterium]|nr:GspH/FimT family pseudopilin [Deltaproteobacteria bacterium]